MVNMLESHKGWGRLSMEGEVMENLEHHCSDKNYLLLYYTEWKSDIMKMEFEEEHLRSFIQDGDPESKKIGKKELL